MIGTPPPNRDRFLCAIAERISPDRVHAVFLFPPIRQGQVETCVAVLAVEPAIVAVEQPVPDTEKESQNTAEESVVEPAVDSAVETAVDSAVEPAINTAVEEVVVAVADPVDVAVEETLADEDVVAEAEPVAEAATHASRPVVLTASYRHTLKGPDRGKWVLEILEQADAPLITIETVVRGVQARLDDQVEPERLGADDLRAALVEGVWTTPAR